MNNFNHIWGIVLLVVPLIIIIFYYRWYYKNYLVNKEYSIKSIKDRKPMFIQEVFSNELCNLREKFCKNCDTAEIKKSGPFTNLNIIKITLLIIILLGAGFRIISCFWGYPFELHPDEPTITKNAIDMLVRKSWEVNVYNRPDHFEIKCCAVLFELFSRLVYHMPASEAWDANSGVFLIIARLYTALWGILMIPLAYKMSELLKKNSGIFAAFLVAFSSIYIQHSAYATPDVTLAFMVMLMAYLSSRFFRGGGYKRITTFVHTDGYTNNNKISWSSFLRLSCHYYRYISN